jgi:hypothetical protein
MVAGEPDRVASRFLHRFSVALLFHAPFVANICENNPTAAANICPRQAFNVFR